MMPSCLKLFRVGLNDPTAIATKEHRNFLLWGVLSSSLSFFLASFQVHEKSILLAIAPCSLLFWEDPIFVEWFSIVCVWTLWPLMQVDRLHSAYFCIVTIFASMI